MEIVYRIENISRFSSIQNMHRTSHNAEFYVVVEKEVEAAYEHVVKAPSQNRAQCQPSHHRQKT